MLKQGRAQKSSAITQAAPRGAHRFHYSYLSRRSDRCPHIEHRGGPSCHSAFTPAPNLGQHDNGGRPEALYFCLSSPIRETDYSPRRTHCLHGHASAPAKVSSQGSWLSSLLLRSRSHRSFERLHSAHDTDGRPIFLGMTLVVDVQFVACS